MQTFLVLLALAASEAVSTPVHPRQNAPQNATTYSSPPVYPAPKGGWVPSWRDAYEKAQKLVEQMTLAEKVNVTTATGWQMGRCVGNTGTVERLGFPSLCAQDGPMGIRFADNATAWPAGITTGATWSRDLIYRRANALAQEARGKGIHISLGPAPGPLGRAPRGGRNWEGFGSDPYLQGEATYLSVKGMQDAGVQSTVKHYIGNEQEHFRGDGGNPNVTSSDIDDRTLHEVYLPPFAQAVRAGVASVMCGYNTINGSYACENSKLMNGILKDELGFQGYIMSDWLAQRSGVGSILAGLDQTQPGDGARWMDGVSFWGGELSRAVLNGTVPLDRLNDAVTRIVAAWYKLGQDKDYPPLSFSSWTDEPYDVAYKGNNSGPVILVNEYLDVRADHGELADTIARDAITLLKNVDEALPLDTSDIIKVFGTHAGNNPNGPNNCTDRACNIGVLTHGWGSGSVELPEDLVAPIDALRELGNNVEWYNNDNITDELTEIAAVPEAKCIVSITADSGEYYLKVEDTHGDRNDLYAWDNGDELVLAVASICRNTIVMIHSVGPIIMERWIEHPNVTAVLLAHLPGQSTGFPLTDVLFGKVSPSGHLPYTIGKTEEDYGESVRIITEGSGFIPQPYTEGLYIDYRHFDRENITPRFEFGFGLSYTTFEISNLTITVARYPSEIPPIAPPRLPTPEYSTEIPDPSEVAWPESISSPVGKFIYPYLDNPYNTTGNESYPYPLGYTTEPFPPAPASGGEGGNPALWDVIFQVKVTVRNTGTRTGKVVPQLYLGFPKCEEGDEGCQDYDTPVRQLRGFEKVGLQLGEDAVVNFDLTRRDLSVWDVVRQMWVMPQGGRGRYTVEVGESSRKFSVVGQTPVI